MDHYDQQQSPPSPAAELLQQEIPCSPSLSASTYDSDESISEMQERNSISKDQSNHHNYNHTHNHPSQGLERSFLESQGSDDPHVEKKRKHLLWLKNKRKRKRRRNNSTQVDSKECNVEYRAEETVRESPVNLQQDIRLNTGFENNVIYCYDHTSMMKQVQRNNTENQFNYQQNFLDSPIESRFHVSLPPLDTKEMDAEFIDRAHYFELDRNIHCQEQKGEKILVENRNESEKENHVNGENNNISPYTSIHVMNQKEDEMLVHNLTEEDIKDNRFNWIQLKNLDRNESIMERRLRIKQRPWLHPIPRKTSHFLQKTWNNNNNNNNTNNIKNDNNDNNNNYYLNNTVKENYNNNTNDHINEKNKTLNDSSNSMGESKDLKYDAVEPISSANTQRIVSWRGGIYINCDLRYFNLSSLGKFDMIIVDPPWRISGAQRHYQEANMFSNARFNLQYNTLSNEEIFGIDVNVLSDQGYCFLWVVNSALQLGIECLNRWGYTYVDRITWVKKQGNQSLHISNGYYFLHSSETCLIGVKYKKGEKLQYIPKVSNDLIFADIREKSRKPDELYLITEAMMPGARKIELFAKNHNIRKGWLSVGNRLGPNYETWEWKFHCDQCSELIEIGNKRYKSRTVKNMDLCESCFTKLEESEDNFYILENNLEEVAFHDWFTCDKCSSYPICGIRFSCEQCDNFDLCENCFDEYIVGESPEGHIDGHQFRAIEIPYAGAGFAVHHNIRCKNCLTCPILGERFHCTDCDIDLCRNCFFKKKEIGLHRPSHSMILVPEPRATHAAKCVWCKTNPISGPFHKCNICLSFNLCDRCYHRREEFPYHLFPAHKWFHPFSKIN